MQEKQGSDIYKLAVVAGGTYWVELEQYAMEEAVGWRGWYTARMGGSRPRWVYRWRWRPNQSISGDL